MTGPDALVLAGVAVARGPRQVLRGIDLTIAPGSVLAVVGPNGSGKSSLLLVASGLLAPAAGTVTIGGRPVAGMGERQRALALAYLPQRSQLMATLRVDEVVAMGASCRALGWGGPRLDRTHPAVAAALAEVGISHLAERRFDQLSGGETQRVLLARALAQGAPLLILDEPTSALDIRHRLEFARLIRGLARTGRGVLLAVHDLGEAAMIADHVLMVAQGGVVAQGPVGAVIAPGPVRTAFGVNLQADGGFRYSLVEREEMHPSQAVEGSGSVHPAG